MFSSKLQARVTSNVIAHKAKYVAALLLILARMPTSSARQMPFQEYFWLACLENYELISLSRAIAIREASALRYQCAGTAVTPVQKSINVRK